MGGAARLPAARREAARSPPGPAQPAPVGARAGRSRQVSRPTSQPTWDAAAQPPAVAPSRKDFGRWPESAGRRQSELPARPAAKAAARGAALGAVQARPVREPAGCARALPPGLQADRQRMVCGPAPRPRVKERARAPPASRRRPATGSSPRHWSVDAATAGGSARSEGSARGAPSGFGAGSGCSGHVVSSPSGTARGSVSVAAAGRPGANGTPARTMFCSITTSVGPADDEEMLHIVAADEHEAAAVVDRRLIDHGKPRLAATRRRTAKPSAAEPAQQPEGEHEQAQHHHQEQQNFRTGLSFAEQGIQDHSSLRPRGVACRSGSPEWLTPLANIRRREY